MLDFVSPRHQKYDNTARGRAQTFIEPCGTYGPAYSLSISLAYVSRVHHHSAWYLCAKYALIPLFRGCRCRRRRAYVSPIARNDQNAIFRFKTLPARRRRRRRQIPVLSRLQRNQQRTIGFLCEQRRIPEGEVHGRIQKFDCRMEEQRRTVLRLLPRRIVWQHSTQLYVITSSLRVMSTQFFLRTAKVASPFAKFINSLPDAE